MFFHRENESDIEMMAFKFEILSTLLILSQQKQSVRHQQLFENIIQTNQYLLNNNYYFLVENASKNIVTQESFHHPFITFLR